MFEQADEFLAAQRIRRRLSNHSIRCYGSALTRMAKWMAQHGEHELSEANIEAYLREMMDNKCSRSTFATATVVLNRWIKFYKLPLRMPGLTMPRPRRQADYISPEEIGIILANIPLGCEICDRCLLAFFDDRHNNFSLRSGEAYRLKAV